MPSYLFANTPFPPVCGATSDGLVAIGGDLGCERLLLAYSQGIFPWYSDNSPILWWSPDPRCVLPLNAVRFSRRLLRKARNTSLHCTHNAAFARVIAACACIPRPHQHGTWLTRDMQRAYIRLHQRGHAHSVECWQGTRLVGGVYGVIMGKAFFGESMFHTVPDASKLALYSLVTRLNEQQFQLFDCQQETPHMLALGAVSIAREDFIQRVAVAVKS